VTPIKTNEGILDWKSIDWILHPDNQGIASNIPPCLEKILYDPGCYNHHFVYQDGNLMEHYSEMLNPMVEIEPTVREEYLNHCRMASVNAI
jgi:8-oxo-dGTP diphosphatase